jgi:hypothetical protein
VSRKEQLPEKDIIITLSYLYYYLDYFLSLLELTGTPYSLVSVLSSIHICFSILSIVLCIAGMSAECWHASIVLLVGLFRFLSPLLWKRQ